MTIEPLEARIAPAMVTLHIVDPHTATYNDLDGDLVTVKVSAGTLTPGLFTGTSMSTSFGPADQLQELNLTTGGFDHAVLSITAKPQMLGGTLRGDGLVNVGWINSTGHDLSLVTVRGDLGKLVAGAGPSDLHGVASLSVVSLGIFSATGAPDLHTAIDGKLGSLRVIDDTNFGVDIHATIAGAINIGGSLNGSLESDQGIGFIKVGGNAGGAISAGGDIAGVKVGGLMSGLFVTGSVGVVTAGGGAGMVFAGNSLAGITASSLGLLEAGKHLGFARILGSCQSIECTNGDIGVIKIGTSLSEEIESSGNITSITIGSDLLGVGTESGKIDCGGSLASLTIHGSLRGGVGDFNTVTDGHGILHSGQVFAVGPILHVRIDGDLAGGSGMFSGAIHSHTAIGSVSIGGSVLGDKGTDTGEIRSDGRLGPVTIGHDLDGAFASDTGAIVSGGDMGAVTIGGGIFGSSLSGMYPPGIVRDGGIFSGGALASVSVAGSVVGGFESQSGEIVSAGNLGSVKIGGDLTGRSSGAPIDTNGYIEGARIGSVIIDGSIRAGTDSSSGGGALTRNASIRAANDIGSIVVKGSVIGDDSNKPNPVIISARGQAAPGVRSDVAIGKISIGGHVEFTDILAGFDTGLGAKNADAQIGSITVGGDWISTNLIAGVAPGSGLVFGDSNDAKITGLGVKDKSDVAGAVSKISSVVIKGTAVGTFTPDDIATFGIEAQQIVSIRLGGALVPLRPGVSNDLFDDSHPLTTTTGTGDTSDGFDFHAFEV